MLPVVSGADAIRILGKVGFEQTSQWSTMPNGISGFEVRPNLPVLLKPCETSRDLHLQGLQSAQSFVTPPTGLTQLGFLLVVNGQIVGNRRYAEHRAVGVNY